MASVKAERAVLAGIVLLALCARFVRLDAVPPGFYSDEASFAYDAWSILQTGRDRYGALLPVFLRAFDWWWTALPAYLAIPSLLLFGVREFGARCSTALLGALTVPLVYAVVKRRYCASAALVAALLLAVSPWHVHNSRYLDDTVPMVFFFMLGLVLFAKGLDGGGGWFALCGAAWGLAFYTYLPVRVFLPLAVAALCLTHAGELKRRKAACAAGAAVCALVLVPMILFAAREPDHFFLRFRDIALTSRGGTYGGAPLRFVGNYLAHLSPVFLFLRGDANVRNFPQGFGQLYLFELPLVVLGIAACLRRRRNPDARFLLLWLLIYPVPASLTVEGIPHGLRTITALPMFQILAAVGAQGAVAACGGLRGRRRRAAAAGAAAFVCLAAINVAVFFRHYMILYPVYSARAWDYGWREALDYARSVEDSHDRIVLTVLSVGPPTMYPPFYLRVDPRRYQAEQLAGTKYRFEPPGAIAEMYARERGRTLYVVREEELRGSVPVRTVRFPDGGTAFKIVEGKR